MRSKEKFIDFLYSHKDNIVDLLELLNMEVTNTYGVKKVIDLIKDLFIQYQNSQDKKKITLQLISNIFWTWITRTAIILSIVLLIKIFIDGNNIIEAIKIIKELKTNGVLP